MIVYIPVLYLSMISVPSLIVRFRQHYVVFSSDIEKALQNVHLDMKKEISLIFCGFQIHVM